MKSCAINGNDVAKVSRTPGVNTYEAPVSSEKTHPQSGQKADKSYMKRLKARI